MRCLIFLIDLMSYKETLKRLNKQYERLNHLLRWGLGVWRGRGRKRCEKFWLRSLKVVMVGGGRWFEDRCMIPEFDV